MSKRTLFLIFALFVIASVLLVIALYSPNAPKPLPTPTSAPKEPVEQTTLLFGDPTIVSSSSINLNYSLPINIATGNNKVTAVQLELQYDPTVMSNVSVAPGSFFTNSTILLNQIDTKTGRISYAFGISPADQGVMGQGVAATITFRTKLGAPQSTSIVFLPKTLVTAEGSTQSVLKAAASAQIVVGSQN